LIYDTLEIVDPKKSKIKILGKSISYFSLGEGLASLIASVLMIYSFSIKHLAIISAITSWIPLIITFFLVEPPRKKMEKSHKENFKYIYKKLFQQSRLLNLIILNSVFSFAGTLFAVWIFQKYWTNIGIPIFYFGFLWATTNFAVSLSSRYAHKIEKKLGGPLLLVILGLLPIAGYFGISFFDHHILGFLVCLFFQVCRGVGQVILRDALNKRVTGDFRATANSVGQMGVRIFFTCLGPFLGIYIDSHGLPKGSLSMGVFYIFVFIFAMIPLIRERKNFISLR
jgi:MFS family permease